MILRTFQALLDWSARAVWRQIALVSLVSALVLVPGLASLPVTDRDEARFVQASKQMLETGDLVDIRFQDRPRWKKPVGIYWLQAGAAKIAGGGVEAPIWAYRLPSVLGAWLAVLLTLWAARPLLGPRGATVAGLMMATSLLLVAEGHIAKTDAALAASAAAVLGGLVHIFLGKGRWGAALVFWLGIAAAILLKGPVVPAIAIAALAGLGWHRDTRPGLRRLGALWGVPLVIALVSPWLVAIWQVSDGAFFAESLGRDMGAKLISGQEKHWGPPGLYFALLWVTLWPWAALLPGAAAALWADRRSARAVFLAAWVVPFWLILEIVPTKLPHYVLPLYPALALLAAWAVATGPAPPRWACKTAEVLTVLPGLAIVLAIPGLPLFASLAALWQLEGEKLITLLSSGISRPALLLAVPAGILILIAGRAAARGELLRQTAAGVAAAILLYPAILQFALPGLGTAFPSPRLAALINQYRPCASAPAWSVGYHEPSLVFLTETGLRTADPKGAVKALATDPGTLLLVEDRWRPKSLPPHVVRAVVTYFNPNRGKYFTARLLTQDHPRWAACTKRTGR